LDRALVTRPKEALASALRKLQMTRHTIEYAKSDRSLRAFTAEVIWHAKAAEFYKPVQSPYSSCPKRTTT
jgi:hypothetical protein